VEAVAGAAPLTFNWGFLEAPVDAVSSAYVRWQRTILQRGAGRRRRSAGSRTAIARGRDGPIDANRRVRALPAVGFSLLALGVAFVGVLATLLMLVAERRRDLAIRAALGASPARLTWTVVGQGLALTALGLMLGLGLGGAAARTLSSFVYGISPYDALTFGGTAVVIGVGATLMTYVAALRARSVDPLVVLKSE
jgi:predicted lysophospholipase L1 biosynthesis ABC-type transport system permease subunit